MPPDVNSKQDAWLRSRMRHSQSGYTVRKPVRSTQPKLFADITSQLNTPEPPATPVSKTPQSYVTIPTSSKPISDFKALQSPVILNDIKTNSTYTSPRLKPTVGLTRVSHTKVLNRTAVGLRKSSGNNTPSLESHKLTPKLVVSLAIVVFLAGLYVNLTGFRTNHIVEVQAANLTKIANSVTAAAKVKKPTGSPAISTVKPTATDLANYVVAPSLPRYIIIPTIGVDARTLSVGMAYDGSIADPNNIYDAGWDNQSSVPGQPGAMLIDGFVSDSTANGVFYNINKLSQGSLIEVENGSGTIFTYLVIKTQAYPTGNINMTTASEPIIAGRPGLNLITSAGDVIPGTNQFSGRTVVYAALQ
jgi:hypothetical protein